MSVRSSRSLSDAAGKAATLVEALPWLERFRDALVVVNGHHWSPRLPEYPGTFDGVTMHSHEYLSPFEPIDMRGKKIVVVGTAGADPTFVYGTQIANMSSYGMTKAAALIATVKWAIKLKDEGFAVINLSPGLVDTTGTIGENG